MSASTHNDERLAELLVAQVVDGLTPAEAQELERLRTVTGGPVAGFERTAAAITLAARLPIEPLPASLAARLAEQGRFAVSARRQPPAGATELRNPATGPGRRRRTDWGWLAAAASLLLAVSAWWPRFGETPAPPPPAVVSVPVAPTLAESRARAANAPGALRIDWTATPDVAAHGVVGDVVWDNATQTGYMRFVGLAPNDPAREQYQLWVFDGTRDERYPVDGGVFDIPAGRAEVIVPIRARLAVRKPMLFAVTVEKPGGVVVSARERIVVLAQAAAT